MEWALALAAVLAVVAVVFVARPFLRDPAPASDRLDELAPEARERLALAEERDRALAALKELEFDHRTGKITDEDYRRDLGPLRRAAAGALRRVDEGDPSGTRFAAIKRLADRYMTETNWAIVEKLEAFCDARGHTMLELAFSWLLSRPCLSSVIAGATKPEQIEMNVKAAGWKLSAAELAEIDKITRR